MAAIGDDRGVRDRPLIGRDVPLRELEDALAAPPAVVLLSGEAGIGKTRLVGEIEAARATRLRRAARRVRRVRRRGAGLRAGRRRAARPPGGVDRRAGSTRSRRGARRAGRGPAARDARRRRPGRLYELLLDLLGRLAPSARRCCSCSRTSTGPTARRSRCSPSWPATCARSGSRCSPPTASTTSCRPSCAGWPRELSRRRDGAADRARAAGPRRRRAPARGDRRAARCRGAGAASCTRARAATRSSSRSCSPRATRSRRRVAEAVLARVERLDERRARRCSPRPAGTPRTRCSSGSTSRPTRCARRSTPACSSREPDGVAFRHGLIGEVRLRAAAAGRARARCTARSRPRSTDAPPPSARTSATARACASEALAASVEAGLEAARRPRVRRGAACTSSARWSCGTTSVDRVELLARAAQAARFAGDPERAVALCREAIELDRRAGAPRAALRAPRRVPLLGRRGRARVLRARARAAAGRAAAAGRQGPRADGPAALGRGARVLRGGAGRRAPAPRITLGSCSPSSASRTRARRTCARALELAATGEETARAYLHLGELLRVRGDHAGALAAMVDGEREAARLGLRGSFGHFMYVNAADDLLRLGRWDEAAERLAEAARMDLSRTAARCAGRSRGSCTSRAATSTRRGASSTPPPTTGCRASSSRRWRRAGPRWRWPRATPPRRAVHVDGALGGVEDPLYTPPLYSLGAARRGRARRARAGAPPRSRTAARADALLAGARRAGRAAPVSPDAHAHLALARAEHARVAGRRPRRELWPTAAAAFDALAEPYPGRRTRACTRPRRRCSPAATARRGARARRRARHRGRARARGRCARRRRRSPGARGSTSRDAPPPPPRDDDGVGLTTREAEVLRLLADGLTNREIAAGCSSARRRSAPTWPTSTASSACTRASRRPAARSAARRL